MNVRPVYYTIEFYRAEISRDTLLLAETSDSRERERINRRIESAKLHLEDLEKKEKL